MKYRKLRIAWSVGWGILCLLMVAWWIRGYWWQDSGFVKIPPSCHVQFNAAEGRMCLWLERKPLNFWFERMSYPVSVHIPPGDPRRIPWFDVGFWPRMIRVYAAHWVFAVPAGALAFLPWCPRRFTIRGMLIATTLIAMIAGTIAFVDTNFPSTNLIKQ
jgi:hypothetical protein